MMDGKRKRQSVKGTSSQAPKSGKKYSAKDTRHTTGKDSKNMNHNKNNEIKNSNKQNSNNKISYDKLNDNKGNSKNVDSKNSSNKNISNKNVTNKKTNDKNVSIKNIKHKVVSERQETELVRHDAQTWNEHEDSQDVNQELQLEGKNPIIEALRAGQQVDRILIAEGVRQADDIKMLASEKGVKYQFVSRQKIDQLATTKAHQGIIAFLASVTYTDFDEWIESLDMSANPVVIMLAELQDPHNVGSIIRTAEAAGVSGVILAKHRAVGLTATVAKVSAGAIAHMPIIRVTNLAHTLEEMKEKGFWVVGTDAKAEKNYYEVNYNMPTVLVIGSEGKGMGPLLEKKCDYLIKIPMLGKVTSLNASVATGIMTYEIIKQKLSSKK